MDTVLISRHGTPRSCPQNQHVCVVRPGPGQDFASTPSSSWGNRCPWNRPKVTRQTIAVHIYIPKCTGSKVWSMNLVALKKATSFFRKNHSFIYFVEHDCCISQGGGGQEHHLFTGVNSNWVDSSDSQSLKERFIWSSVGKEKADASNRAAILEKQVRAPTLRWLVTFI